MNKIKRFDSTQINTTAVGRTQSSIVSFYERNSSRDSKRTGERHDARLLVCRYAWAKPIEYQPCTRLFASSVDMSYVRKTCAIKTAHVVCKQRNYFLKKQWKQKNMNIRNETKKYKTSVPVCTRYEYVIRSTSGSTWPGLATLLTMVRL